MSIPSLLLCPRTQTRRTGGGEESEDWGMPYNNIKMDIQFEQNILYNRS
jgi:hypothetical protein